MTAYRVTFAYDTNQGIPDSAIQETTIEADNMRQARRRARKQLQSAYPLMILAVTPGSPERVSGSRSLECPYCHTSIPYPDAFYHHCHASEER